MHKYIPNTEAEKKEMLKTLGFEAIDELFNAIPDNCKFDGKLAIPKGKSELELLNHFKALGQKNKSLEEMTCFLGAGAYDHFVPSVVGRLASRSEFYTAYTPYQAEISQGTLRVIFEYQSMIAELTGMDVSNASLYDGQTAVVEAAFMAMAASRKEKIVVSTTVHPEARQVLKTYLEDNDIEIVEIAMKDGVTDIEELKAAVDKETAGVIVQSPNFLGNIEDVEAMAKSTDKTRALFIQSVDPIALGLLKSPGDLGVDIAVGDGQALGNGMNFGGPYLGFIATKSKYVRKLPGRIVGQTEDAEGNRAFTLTLQTREQHIRREKATSNICSNQGLNALMATIYLATVGKDGLKEIATQCVKKAHYAYNEIINTDGYEAAFDQPFFKEFVVKSKKKVKDINEKLLDHDILGGYDLSQDYPSLKNSSLYCVTEKRTIEEIDTLVDRLEAMDYE